MSKILFSKNKMNEDFKRNNRVDEFNLLTNNPFCKLLNRKEMSSLIVVLTALITFGSFVIKLLYYVGLKGFLYQYGISINSINYLNYNGLFDFLYYFFIFIGFAMPIYLFYYDFKILLFYIPHKAAKTAFKYLLCPTFLIFLLNIFTSIIIKDNFIIIWSMLYLNLFFSMVIFEIIMALIFVILFKIISLIEKKIYIEYIEKDKNAKKNINLYVVLITIFIPLFTIMSFAYIEGKNIAKTKCNYCIISRKYAVIYQNENYYWTIPVSINEDEGSIELYTHAYQIIDKNGVILVPESFVSVDFIYYNTKY